MVSRLFKAKYFPKCNFLDAKVGNNPSYVWRSIWEAKSLLKSGARWMIGAGHKISIVNQLWLQDDNNPYITSTSPTFEDNSVASLMCINERRWDEDIVKDLYKVRDQQCILNTPLRHQQYEDRLYWDEEVSGNYTVKSAYKLLQSQKGMWNKEDSGSLWGKLWRIRAPPKALNLVWRALAFCLPTMTMLQQKHVPVLSICPVCNGEDETIMPLVRCPFATQGWHSLFPSVQQVFESGFYDWLERLLKSISADNHAIVIMVCWAIWRARNEKHWNKKQASMNIVLATAKQHLVQWQNAQGRSTEALVQSNFEGDGANTWVKPQFDYIKVTVDAAIFKEQQTYGMSMVARNHEGELVQGLQAKALKQYGVVTPELAFQGSFKLD